MRICFFVHRFAPSIGGVELAVERIATALTSDGHAVTIVTETPAPPADVDAGSVRRVHLQIPRRRPVTRALYWKWMLRRRREWNAYDVLHFHDYGTFVHWFLPVRCVVRRPVYAMTFHGFDSWPVRRRDDLLRRWAASRMDVTFGVGDYVSRHYGQRIDRTYVGAPLRRPAGPTTPDPRCVLFIGRLEPDTGCLEAARCLRAAADATGCGMRLIVVGDGSQAADIEGVRGGCLDVSRRAPTTDVEDALSRCGIVIATGLLSMLDALAFGSAVVVPAFTPIKRDYARSIPGIESMAHVATSPPELTALFTRLIREPDDAEWTARGAAYAQALSWTDIAREHVEGYEHARRRHA